MYSIVTGGAGFIGSHICEELNKQGHEVCSLDDYSAGYEYNVPSGVCQIIADISKYNDLENVIKLRGVPETIYHQAASKKNICLINPVRDIEVNTIGAYNVAILCKKYDIRMVHASTGSVYGEAVQKQNEQHPINPRSYYGISKFAGERYASLIANATILRYFHVYGSRQESNPDRGGVIAIWIDRIKQGLPIVVYGDGNQERSFTYVKDVVKANLLNLESGVYNCASGFKYTLHDLINELKSHFGEFEVIYKDWLIGDVKYFDVDNSKIGMKWVNLHDGLNHLING